MESSGVAFLGTGVMGSALARGIAASGAADSSSIVVFDIDESKMSQLAGEIGASTAASASEAVSRASVVFLCAKPPAVPALVSEIAGSIDRQLLLSIAAGVSISKIKSLLQEGAAVARVMPNTPALLREGVSAAAFSPETTPAQRAEALRLLEAVGLAVEVDESLMDAVTGLSGSGPAYVFTFIEALADAGVSSGIPRAAAQQMAAQTVLGAARMALESGKHPAELKNQVTTPGGTTAAGLAELEASAFRAAVARAVTAAAKRSQEMSR